MAGKVLIICRSYYPHYGPQAHRAGKFAKYLKKFGWEPVILCSESTPQNDAMFDAKLIGQDVCRTIRVPYNISAANRSFNFLVRKMLKHLSLEVLQFLSPRRLYYNVLARADKLLQEEKFDVILATTPAPFALAIADKMSRKYHIPWIADYRDIPAQHKSKLNPCSPYHLLIKAHQKCCSSAGALITVSQPLYDKLKKWHQKTIYLIFNGYDPDDYHKEIKSNSEYFTLVYCGTIHDSANPGILLDALDFILKKDPRQLERFRILIYGVPQYRFHRLFAQRPCSQLFHCKGRVSFSESIRAQQEATALLFLAYPEVAGIMTAKIFEYLGAGRPILSVPGDIGVTDDILAETQAGMPASSPQQTSKILLNWIDQWRNTGKVNYQALPEKIQAYTREKQTEQLAQILEKAVAGHFKTA
ncbi:MAG: hypothetical protein AMJ79_02105 [Phycisphaerae bacterium SM23_30]|nr:MAG: hypothetical protein AMJ79_02105 [Phycisphaerae bacterium SM23_30]